MVAHYEGEFIKTKLHYISLIVIWLGWTPSTLTPGVQGAQKRARWGSGASAVHFGGHFIKQKLLGTPNLEGVRHLIGPQIQIWKELGPVGFWSWGASFPRRVY